MLKQRPHRQAPPVENPDEQFTKNTSSKKTGRRRWLRPRYFLLALGLLLLLVGFSAFQTYQTVRARAESGMQHFQAALDQLKGDNVSASTESLNHLRQELDSAGTDFRQAHAALGPFGLVLPLVGWLPGPAYDLANLDKFLDMAENAARLGSLTLQGVQPAVSVFETTGPISGKLSLAIDALAKPESQARFSEAANLLAIVNERRAALDRERLNLSQTRKAIDQFDQQIPNLKDALKLVRELPPLLPDVLGKERPVNYLALIQNSDELRPTGGFISSVGLITLDQGRMSLSSFQDSYKADNPNITPGPPPEALARYMQANYLFLRDANWWPAFPTSANQIARYYEQHQSRTIDSVVAIDSQAVAYLFEALGPLDLPAYNERLTAQNFEERLRYYYLPPNTDTTEEWWLKLKEFIGVALNGLLSRLNGASARDYIKVFSWLGKAMTEKHLQVYFNNPALESQLTERALDGAQLNSPVGPGINDYWMIAEANVGFNKVNPGIERSASYSLAGGGAGSNLFASLTLTYTNRAGVREGTKAGECIKVAKYDVSYASMLNGCYWNYLRVYVPQGSQLRETTGLPAERAPTTSVENNKTVFATQLVVPPGQSVSVTFNYTLPYLLPASALSNYQLQVQKQAGVPPFPVAIQVLLPDLTRSWTETLATDRRFEFNKGGN